MFSFSKMTLLIWPRGKVWLCPVMLSDDDVGVSEESQLFTVLWSVKVCESGFVRRIKMHGFYPSGEKNTIRKHPTHLHSRATMFI